MDGHTDRWMDRPSDRDAMTHLKGAFKDLSVTFFRLKISDVVQE